MSERTRQARLNPGTMVFWVDEKKPRWVVEFQPHNGPGAYWLIDSAGRSAAATRGELSFKPQVD